MTSSITQTGCTNTKLKSIGELQSLVNEFLAGTDTSRMTKCLETSLGCFENVSLPTITSRCY